MSDEVPAPVAEITPPLDAPRKRQPGDVYDAKLGGWRPRKRLGRPPKPIRDSFTPAGFKDTHEYPQLVDGEKKALHRFDIDDWRDRMQGKSREIAELAADELRERLSHPEKVARIPTSVLQKVLKYLDERECEIAKRMKEEGLEKNAAPVEEHRHLTVFQFPPGVFESLPVEAQQAIETQRLRAIEAKSG